MTHPRDLLSALLDQELADDELTMVQGHLESCGECRSELAELEAIRRDVRSLPMLEAPIPLLPAERKSMRWITAAASVAAAVVIGIAVVPAQAPALDLDTMAGQHTARVVVDPGISTIRGPAGGR